VMRLLPPLIVEDTHIDEAMTKIAAACDTLLEQETPS